MLQIRLSKPASESGGGGKPVQTETVRVACPDHLVLADLPVAKGLGSATATSVTKTNGRRSLRQLGKRVHFCVQCDFPIAIYGRLSPCEHAFCLDCARSDSLCYLCDERIQKIQTIKMMDGIFICAAPHCLKSFLQKSDLELHIKNIHVDLLHLSKVQQGNESEAVSSRIPSASDSTVQASLASVFSPTSNSQIQDRDDRTSRGSRPIMQQTPVPPFQNEANQPQPFDRAAAPQNHFPWPMNPNMLMPPPQFGFAPYPSDGTQQQYYGAPLSEFGQEKSSMLGYSQGHGPTNFPQNSRWPWNANIPPPGSVPLEPPMVSSQGANFPPQPPPHLAPPPHLVQQIQRVRSYSGDSNPDAPPGFGWQPERRDGGFGGAKD